MLANFCNIRFEDCEFTNLHLPTNVKAPEGEPLSLTLERCRTTDAEDYGDQPFVRTSGHREIVLKDVSVEAPSPYIEANDANGITIESSPELDIRTIK